MNTTVKILLVLLLCFSFVFSLASCGKRNSGNVTNDPYIEGGKGDANEDGGKVEDNTPVLPPVEDNTPDLPPVEDDEKLESFELVNGEVIAYGKDGNRINYNRQFINYNNNTYYAINNKVVTGDYVIDGGAYRFDETGIKLDVVLDKIFVECEGNTYYIINNVTVYNEIVINGNVYNFGTDGAMKKDYTDGEHHYGSDGKLVADKIFITIEGNTYYIINNVTVYNKVVINGNVYNFGTDGAMKKDYTDGEHHYGSDGKLVADKIFITIEGNTYYIINNVTVYNKVVINGNVYNFGTDGAMKKDYTDGEHHYGSDGKLVADKVFITIEGNTYYIVNNVTVYNKVVINGNVYNFGTDGAMKKDYTDGEHHYGSDGKLVADKVFITIEGNTYYIVNNTTVYNEIVINGNVYNFGTDGAMKKDYTDGDRHYGSDGKLVADKIFITIEGNTYYIINNVTVYNEIIINGNIYNFGSDGAMMKDYTDGDRHYGSDGRLVADEIFITIKGNTYYIVNNTTVYNEIVINGNVYNFGSDGKMVTGSDGDKVYDESGKLVADKEFVTIDGYTYYMLNNNSVKDCYMIIDGRVYYFDSYGRRLENTDFDGHHFGNDGYIDSQFDSITIDGKLYCISNGVAYTPATISGYVFSSDHDLDQSNNAPLSGVSVSYTVLGQTFTAITDESGAFTLSGVPHGSGEISFSVSGYFTTSMSLNINGDESLNVVLDRDVIITLSGKVVKADSDSNLSNNTVISGAMVKIEKITGTSKFKETVYTNSNGNYSITGLTEGVYTLTVSFDGCITTTQTLQVRYNQATLTNTTIELVSNASTPGYASGYIKEARYGSYVSGLTVYIYSGINNHYGEYIYVTTTNSSGYFITDALAPGNYTAYIVDERSLADETYRYNPLSLPLKIISGTTIDNQNGTVSNGEGISVDGIRMVLTWGADPCDLDSYLEFGSYTVYFGKKTVGNCKLDTDDTSGYGPETITISQVENYTYNYYIYHCYGNGSIATSGACVTIYFGNDSTPAYVIYPPDQEGLCWSIFSYNAITGEFIIHNSISNSAITK